jgi:hypothetical protein
MSEVMEYVAHDELVEDDDQDQCSEDDNCCPLERDFLGDMCFPLENKVEN